MATLRGIRLRAGLRALIAAAFLAIGSANAPARELVLATASPGGTYHPVGVAIATLVRAELSVSHGESMVATPTAGSVENIALIERGAADLAIVQALVAHDAWHGKGEFTDGGARRGFRAVTSLWQNVEQFVLRAEHVRTGNMADLLALRGAAVGLGERGSGTLLSNRILIGHLGVDIERAYRLVYLGYGPAAEALHAGEVAAIGLPAGLPTKSLTRVKAAMGDGAAILAFTPDQAVRADGGLGLWTAFEIPAGTYPGQPEPIPTIAQQNLLVASGRLPADTVYRIIQVIYEKREFLRAIHEATRAITFENALSGLPVPLHGGARRFFEEAGLAIPSRLSPIYEP